MIQLSNIYLIMYLLIRPPNHSEIKPNTKPADNPMIVGHNTTSVIVAPNAKKVEQPMNAQE